MARPRGSDEVREKLRQDFLSDLDVVKAWVAGMSDDYVSMEFEKELYDDIVELAEELGTTPEMIVYQASYRFLVKKGELQ